MTTAGATSFRPEPVLRRRPVAGAPAGSRCAVVAVAGCRRSQQRLSLQDLLDEGRRLLRRLLRSTRVGGCQVLWIALEMSLQYGVTDRGAAAPSFLEQRQQARGVDLLQRRVRRSPRRWPACCR